MPFDSELFLLANCLPPVPAGLLDHHQAILCVVTRISECSACFLDLCTSTFHRFCQSPDVQLVAVVPFQALLGSCMLLEAVVDVALDHGQPCMSFALSY